MAKKECIELTEGIKKIIEIKTQLDGKLKETSSLKDRKEKITSADSLYYEMRKLKNKRDHVLVSLISEKELTKKYKLFFNSRRFFNNTTISSIESVSAHINSHSNIDYDYLDKHPYRAGAGRFTLDSEMSLLTEKDMQEIIEEGRVEIFEITGDMAHKSLSEIATYFNEKFSKTHYFPGFELIKYVLDDANEKTRIMFKEKLISETKDLQPPWSRLNLFLGSIICGKDGQYYFPCIETSKRGNPISLRFGGVQSNPGQTAMFESSIVLKWIGAPHATPKRVILIRK